MLKRMDVLVCQSTMNLLQVFVTGPARPDLGLAEDLLYSMFMDFCDKLVESINYYIH
jgi:hypothetical protein